MRASLRSGSQGRARHQDRANGIDEAMDVAIANGRIAAVAKGLSGGGRKRDLHAAPRWPAPSLRWREAA